MKNLSLRSLWLALALFAFRFSAAAEDSSTDSAVRPANSTNLKTKEELTAEAGFQRVDPPSKSEIRELAQPPSKGKTGTNKNDWMKEMPVEQQVFLQSQVRKTEQTKVETKSKTQGTKGASTVRTSTKAGGASGGSKKKAKKF